LNRLRPTRVSKLLGQASAIVHTTSEVALGALVEEQRILQVARSRDFLHSSIWPRRVALVIFVELLALGVAISMCAFGIGLESRPLPHPACSVAIRCSAHLEVSGSSRISAGPAAGVMASPESVQTSVIVPHFTPLAILRLLIHTRQPHAALPTLTVVATLPPVTMLLPLIPSWHIRGTTSLTKIPPIDGPEEPHSLIHLPCLVIPVILGRV
jgi:hypothetical protein